VRLLTWENVRTVAVFSVGLAGIVHQTVFREVDRPFLLALFAAMIGLEYAFRRDSTRRENVERQRLVDVAEEEERWSHLDAP
jgi:hypothetical protein